ncbi:MAG: hypothetical protein EBS64_10055 [Verrucomicrobia bacterium]|nr:hypothetical protein [Verrucomicrobiota bacterium]NBY36002.1 hypothetical protein [Verrucomicrobiota bacterium]
MNLEDPSPSPRTLEHRLLRLLQAVRDTQDTSARAELNMLLRDIPEARPIMARLMVDEQALISRLREDGIVELLEPARTQKPAPRMRTRWFAWRPLTAMTAGVVFGLFGASVLLGFGLGGRRTEKVTSLFVESFESGPAPLVTGVPQQLNQWSGDFSELVGEQQGVRPVHGTKMIRILRSDYEGKISSKRNFQGDLMRVVDVRPFSREINGGEVVLSTSALFNAAPFPETERYDGVVTLYALGELGSTEKTLLEDSLAHSYGLRPSLDRNPGTWEQATSRLQLPAGTEYVIVKVSVRRWPKDKESQSSLPSPVTFAGHFVDDVRVSINIRNTTPAQRN